MNLKTLPEISHLLARRKFLKRMSLALCAPGIPAALRYAVNDILGGTAYAAEIEGGIPTYFIEFNYRDQLDFGEVAIAPGLATAYTNLIRGETGQKAALFFDAGQLINAGNNFYLTPDSEVLRPHLDTIAFIDSGELTDGAIHGHQAANRNRAPDCATSPGAGQKPMWTRDPTTNFPAGVEPYHSAIPTPASLHNYVQKLITPGLRNGVVFKGVTRAKHTIYHFGANLPGAELDRMQSKPQLFDAFPGAGDPNSLPTVPNASEAEFFARILKRVDPTYLQQRNYEKTVLDGHLSEITAAQKILAGPMMGTVNSAITLPLTSDETAYWKAGVPEQGADGRTMFANIKQDADTLTRVKFQVWEQYALAYKLIAGGRTRTVAGDCEFIDWHDTRPRANVQCHTLMVALPLSRLIEKLKEAGLYDRTLIAIYTADGSRSPAANSNGSDNVAKMTIILAGGMIKGGYYGDIRIAGTSQDGHRYAIHMPDITTGEPVPNGSTTKTGRLPGSVVWKTVAKAMRVPDDIANQFSDMASARTMDFLLRA